MSDVAQLDWRVVRARLRNPPNAVRDDGIDLKRKRALPVVLAVVDTTPLPPPDWYYPLHDYNEQLRRLCRVPLRAAMPESIYIPPTVRMADIIAVVCKYYGISRRDLLSHRRTANLTFPRHVVMYLARTLTVRSLPEIGQFLGGKDHTTILHGYRKIEALRKTDAALDCVLTSLEASLKPAE